LVDLGDDDIADKTRVGVERSNETGVQTSIG
jgi:hypothetical protein